MSLIITMAGNSKRFFEAGYLSPKYQIITKNNSLFYWSMSSLKQFFDKKFIFIVKKSDAASSFITQECNKLKISHFCIIELDGPTNGQATTVMHGLSECLPDEPLGIYNIDTYVEPYQLSLPSEKDFGFIPCFTPSGDHWSFVKTQPNGDVTQITEKIRISDFATLGLYWFKNPQLYKECYDTYYGASQTNFVKGEAYIAPLYNELLAKGLKVSIEIIGNEFVHAIGTPSELLAFEGGLG